MSQTEGSRVLMKQFNMILDSEKMPEEQRKSVQVLSFTSGATGFLILFEDLSPLIQKASSVLRVSVGNPGI